MAGWMDTHVHLDDAAFDPDRDAVIARAAAAGVAAMICAGTSVEGSRRAVSLAERHPQVFAAVGVHPQRAASLTGAAVHELEALVRHPRVVAIGETGLDFARGRADAAAQHRAFAAHARLAREAGLPLVVHNREASEDVERILDNEGVCAVVMHCFTGSPDLAVRWALAGWMISVAGPLTFPKSEALREAARRVPLDRLLVETDAPYLSPVPMRGRRCEPSFVVHTARALAGLRQMSDEALASALADNTARAFPRGWARGETAAR